jgi:hypothetical protein
MIAVSVYSSRPWSSQIVAMPLSMHAMKTIKMQVIVAKTAGFPIPPPILGWGSLQTALSSEQTGLQIPVF